MLTTFGWRKCLVLAMLGLCLALTLRFAFPPKKRLQYARPRPDRMPALTIDYAHFVKPILEARCVHCHGPAEQKAGLRLDTVAAIRKGGGSGAVIIPGDGANSLLIAVLLGTEDHLVMPPSGESLPGSEIALIKTWIDAGALPPANEEPGSAEPLRVDHWAFRPPLAHPVPDGAERNPIDAYLAAGWKRKGLTPNPPIDRSLLLRRVTIDLAGLPPTRDELVQFLSDPAADSYEKAVDRLLARPQYGERWGRHWMDIWRYSDPDGRKAKNAIWWGNAHIWRWRDWIVKSLNADKGYDRMIVEMLAGDEVAPNDPETLAATGFLVRNWFGLDRNIWLNNTIEHTGKAFLGITIGCARCHDHKYDPITQKEYYQLRAFFEPHDVRTVPMPGAAKDSKDMLAHAYDARPNEPTWIFVRGQEKTPDKSIPIVPGIPAAFGGPPLTVTPVPAVSASDPPSTGRRLALARWIADRQNPLAARVAVNHIWARHFGQPLVEHVVDFGVRTAPPQHYLLLDWLAVQFMEHQWSMKWLHRLIVTSMAYRMQSSPPQAPSENLAIDPDNRCLWRMNPRRMEAEVVRDSLLWLGGALDESEGGPPIDPALGGESARRSLYYRYSREDKMEFLVAFDAAGVEECYRRQESIIPQQALALENSEFVWDQARRITRRLDASSSGSTARDFIGKAFEHILGRAPLPAEADACERFLAQQERLFRDPSRLTAFPPPPPPPKFDPELLKKVPGLPLVLGVAKKLPAISPASEPAGRARENLIHALLNHNDFITVR